MPVAYQPGDVSTFDGIKFVWIPAGKFRMGSPKSESGRYKDEGPIRTVRITTGFWMGKYEVTKAQYERVMGKNPSHSGDSKHPVSGVRWDDAVSFCRELSRSSGATYHLPTEAEWEYACRAGTTTRFYTGDSDSDLDRAGWYDGNSGLRTHTIGEKEPNAWGLYDMHGNVWVWCWDWYDDDYYRSRPDPDSDPRGASTGSSRVGRGGSWYHIAQHCRSAVRSGYYPGHCYSHGGFRLCRSN